MCFKHLPETIVLEFLPLNAFVKIIWFALFWWDCNSPRQCSRHTSVAGKERKLHPAMRHSKLKARARATQVGTLRDGKPPPGVAWEKQHYASRRRRVATALRDSASRQFDHLTCGALALNFVYFCWRRWRAGVEWRRWRAGVDPGCWRLGGRFSMHFWCPFGSKLRRIRPNSTTTGFMIGGICATGHVTEIGSPQVQRLWL